MVYSFGWLAVRVVHCMLLRVAPIARLPNSATIVCNVYYVPNAQVNMQYVYGTPFGWRAVCLLNGALFASHPVVISITFC